MTDQPIAYVVMIGDFPSAVATDFETAKAAALAQQFQYSPAAEYETRWDERGNLDGWRLMQRRKGRGGRYSWTQRSIRTAPFLPVTEA